MNNNERYSVSFSPFCYFIVMANFNWVYNTEAGQRYMVGLYHGPNTGHLLVYCNSRIVLIDFHVLQSATYSFFIEEELCEIVIDRDKNTFTYNFKINREIDTPSNRIWHQRVRTDRKKAILLASGFVLSVVLGVAFFIYIDKKNQQEPKANYTEWLRQKGTETTTRVFIEQQDGDTVSVRYAFIANGQVYESKGRLPAKALINGLPLVSGDEFMLRFAETHPFVHEVDYNNPSAEQVQRYRNRVIDRHIQLHPELSEQRIKCLVEIAYEIGGLDGLANFYFQDAEPNALNLYNKLTYQRFIRDVPFSQKAAERCL